MEITISVQGLETRGYIDLHIYWETAFCAVFFNFLFYFILFIYFFLMSMTGVQISELKHEQIYEE